MVKLENILWSPNLRSSVKQIKESIAARNENTFKRPLIQNETALSRQEVQAIHVVFDEKQGAKSNMSTLRRWA